MTTMSSDSEISLSRVIDSGNYGVPKHLGRIADSMDEWEGPVAEELNLTKADVAKIKLKYPIDLNLQTREALELWKQRLGSATYNDLIGVFERAGYQDYADTVREIFCPSKRRLQMSRTPRYIMKYAKCLKELYSEKAPFPHPEWPPNKATEPTKLFIISVNRTGSTEDGFSKTAIKSTQYDYVYEHDSIIAYKKEIELADILNPVQSDDNKPPKEPKVLMDGSPGVGKTTLALKACSEWAKGNLFVEYELVVLVSLRQARYRDAKKLEDLFPQGCYHDPKVIDHYLQNNGKRLVLIFDGYDELTSDQREYESIFLEIIRGDMLPKAAVLITSRPYASNYLQQLKSINRHVELVGFKKEQIYACIQKNICDNSSANNLMKQLEEREDILSLCYIPLNCMIMINVYEQNKTLSTTMTELFDQFVTYSVKREVKLPSSKLSVQVRFGVQSRGASALHSLPEPKAEGLKSLEKLAYQNLVKDQFVFSEKELQLAFNNVKADDITSQCLGLITSVHANDKMERYFQFLHLSVQEFLAASYAVKNSRCGEQIDILRRFVNDPRFRLFLLFYVGMMPLENEAAKMLFHSELDTPKNRWHTGHESGKADPIVRKFLYFAHMIYESRECDTFLCLFDAVHDKSSLSLKHHKLTLFDCTILAHFLCTIPYSYEKLDLQDCSLNVQSLQVFNRVYHQRNSGKKLTFRIINFSNNDSEMINNLQIFPWLNDVDELKFISTIGSVSQPLSLFSLAHIPKLNISVKLSNLYNPEESDVKSCICTTTANSVTLSRATLGQPFVKYLCGVKVLELTKVDYEVVQVVNPFLQTLESLVMREVDDTDVWLSHSVSVSSLAASTSLQQLSLIDVHLTAVSVTKLFQSLKNNTRITELNLSGKVTLVSNFSLHKEVELGQALKTLLAVNKTMSSIQLCNCLNDQLVQYLISGLNINHTLKKLDVTNNPLAISSIQFLINRAFNCRNLWQLFIENGVFMKHDTVWTLTLNPTDSCRVLTERLFCALTHIKQLEKCNNTVTKFSLSSKTLDSFTCTRLFQTLQQNKHIKELELNEKFQIIAGDESVIYALEKMLTVNNTLESLYYCSSTDIQPEPHPVCKYLAAGISKSVSLTKLSLEIQSRADIVCILRGLSKSTLKVLKLQCKGDNSSSIFTQTDSELIGSEFEQFFTQNSILVELTLGYTLIDDAIIDGVAKGLLRNKSLKKLIVTVIESLFNQRGTLAKLVPSVTKSNLNCIELSRICSLNRDGGGMDWNLKIYDRGFVAWSQLKSIFTQTETEPNKMHNIKVRNFDISDHLFTISSFAYQMYRIFCALTFSGNLKVITITKLVTIGYDDDEFWMAKVGLAIKKLLAQSTSLEILTLNAKLPRGTWELAADGLSVNSSLKSLDLSNSFMQVSEAASIFDALKSNCTLEKLDVSENFDNIKERKCNDKVISAIEMMFCLNSSLQEVNLKKSIDDETAKKVASGLQKKLSSNLLRKLTLDEHSLSISTIQHMLSLLKDNSVLTLTFDDVSIHSSHIADGDVLSKLVKTFQSDFQKKLRFNKLFCGICNSCFQSTSIVLNITELKFDDVDNEVVIVIFRSLMYPILSKLAMLSLARKLGDQIGGNAVSDGLNNMLKHNSTLLKLIFTEVDEKLILGLASGLLTNNSLKEVEFTVDIKCLNEYLVTELLNTMESPDTGILEINISRIPSIRRPSQFSTWSMVPRSLLYVDDFACFIFTLCKVYENDRHQYYSRSAKSILDSSQRLTLSINQRDFSFNLAFLELLASNCTFTELNLYGNGKLTRDHAVRLCEAIKDMLIKNKTMKVLCLSGVLNDIMVTGVVAGLKKNQTLKRLHVETNTLAMNSIASLLNVINMSGLTSFIVNDTFMLRQHEDFMWQIKIGDEAIWPTILNALKEHAQELKILTLLTLLTNLSCFKYSPRFDLSGETLKFDLNQSTLYANELSSDLQTSFMVGDIKTLSSLTLNSFNFSYDVCEDIATALGSTGLKTLDLSFNSICGQGAVKLFQAIETNHTLVEFNISGNNLKELNTCEGLGLSRMIQNNTSLKILKLANCYIEDQTCDFVSSGIQTNCTLTCLDLSVNDISFSGIIALMQSLQQNSCLQELNLTRNDVFRYECEVMTKTRFGHSVCEMLENNKTLTTLKLNDCGIDNIVLKEITAKNTTLKMLALDIHQCDSSTIKSLVLSMNLTCLICSGACSLLRSDSGWVVEVQRSRIYLQILPVLSLCELDIKKVVISKDSESMLDLSLCSLNHSQFLNLLESLEHNTKVNELTLQLMCTLADTEQESLGHAVAQMLTNNCSLRRLTLHGAVDSAAILKGFETGLEMNKTLEKLTIQVNQLDLSTILNFIQAMETTRLLSIGVIPLLEISRDNLYSSWYKSSFYRSTLYLQYLCCVNHNNLKPYSVLSHIGKLDLHRLDIDDSLTRSLFSSFEANPNLVVLRIKEVGENVLNAFERMLSCNTSLQHLTIDVVDDSVIVAISKGLKHNNTLHTLDINVDSLTDDVLSQLLQSLSSHPLKLVDRLDGSRVNFIRYISELQYNERGEESPSSQLNKQLSNIGKVLKCFTPNNKLKELIITLPHGYRNQSVGSEAMSDALKAMLTICRTLQFLRLQCPVGAEVINGIGAGLKANKTLQCLEINVKTLNMSTISSIFTSLNSSSVVKLELTKQCLYLRVPGSTSWRIEILGYSSVENVMMAHSNLNIDTVICSWTLDEFKLKFLAENFKWILTILRSIECGTVHVRRLWLVCDDAAYFDRNLSEDIGVAIERMLRSKEISLLETLTIVCLRDDIIQKHIVAGISQSSSLSYVIIQDKLPDPENNLAQIIFRADFTNSSIRQLQINDDITLYKGTKRDPFGLNVEGETESDPNWKVDINNNKHYIIKLFLLLSPFFSKISKPHHHGNMLVGEFVFENFKKLDLSHTPINITALFEVLQHDTKVVDLDLSYCTQVVSSDGLDVYQSFKYMLIKNKSLKMLNLAGIMDDMYIISLIEFLPSCSLTSLSINMNTNICTSDRAEALLSSYMKSKLHQLLFTDVCLSLKKDDACNLTISCETAHSFSGRFMRTWNTLVMAIVKSVPRLELTLAPHDALSLKSFRTFFNSVDGQCCSDTNNPTMSLLKSLMALHLGVTCHNQYFIIAVINSIQYCTNLTKLCLSHDKNVSSYVSKLALSYEQLLTTNDTLRVITLGSINDEIAQSIASGLRHNNKLHTLQFSVGALTITSLANLLQSILESNLTFVQITDGCTLRRTGDQGFGFVNVAGINSILLSKMFLVSTLTNPILVQSLVPGNKLDLSCKDISNYHSIDSHLATQVLKCLIEGGNYVSELILSGNINLTDDGGDDHGVMSSALKQLLLSDVSALHTLRLDNCKIPDSICIKISEGLTTNNKLEILDLSHNQLTSYSIGKLLASLTENCALKELYLSKNKLTKTDESAVGSEIEKMLKVNSTLSILCLNENQCGALGKHIAIGLGYNSALRVLSLQISEEEILIKVTESLQRNLCLKELNLAGSSVKTKLAGSAIQQMLKTNASLEVLNMENSGISDEVCILITEGLSQNRNLKTLDLSANSIHNSGVMNLFQMFDRNACCLQELDISFNYANLHSDIVKSCGSILATNSSLRTLAVSRCGYFEEWFGLELLNGLKQNTILLKLDISDNYFDERATSNFTEMLLHNKTLTQLDITGTKFAVWKFNFIEILSKSSVKKLIVDFETKSLLDFDTAPLGMQVEVVDN